ncbi:hypothetical protein H2201_001965 [Coniosporium apollinis]|uniref:Alpha/beta hydrolase fold-3 domain-containing protein n=1 Tax=Coniosporium apollinis TaxID=61459 RepID=A0ABQ9NZJ1_9PEZI|nr:hypothetical protein H2201_001965 [Coniosporium apollinis]
MKHLPWVFSNRYTVHQIPTREGRSVRAIVFQPPQRSNLNRLRPLHINIHSGGFIGGIAEGNASFCALISDRTGAVVVSPEHRAAPRHTFPAAHDDIDDVISFLLKNAVSMFRADPKLLTVSGSSAGCNLALAASQQKACQPPADTAIKASVTFYAPVDLRLPPQSKPIPPNYPTRDPLSYLLPLYDAYAGPSRTANLSNPRLHPILAAADTLPRDMLFIIPTIDILLHEQLTFVERLKRETEGSGRRIESRLVEGQWHGWAELPGWAIDKTTRDDAFDAAIEFLRETHRRYGWFWDGE